MALGRKEFRPKGGSSPITRFVLGFFVMVGCLMFLGCPFRMILRLAGGDMNALAGLVGFVAGILTGIFFLNKGYTLKRSYKQTETEGLVMPICQILLLILLIAVPGILFFTPAEGGPGAKHAALWISLLAGLIVGAIAQVTRLCMVGGIRDFLGNGRSACGTYRHSVEFPGHVSGRLWLLPVGRMPSSSADSHR